jgi:YidC/Oxa1 family membrane protein insertase
MDRKSWIVVALCLVSLFGWQYWYASKYGQRQTAPAPKPGETAPATPGQAAATPETAPAPAPASPDQAAPATPGAAPAAPAIAKADAGKFDPSAEVKFDTPMAEYIFTRHGGGILRARLHKHHMADGSPVIMNEVATQPIGSLELNPNPEKLTIFNVVEQTADKIVFEGDYFPGLRLRKTYEVDKNPELAPRGKEGEYGYALTLTVQWVNSTAAPLGTQPYYLQLGEEEAVYHQDQSIYTTFQWQSNKGQAQRHIDWFKPSYFLWIIQTGGEKPFFSEAFKSVDWAGVNNQFFCTVVGAAEPRGIEVWATRVFKPIPSHGGKPGYSIQGAIKLPGASVPANGNVTEKFRVYTGPKEYSRLKKLPDNEVGILNFGFFSPISVFLLNTMNFFQHYLHSYALAIIGITVMLKILLWPLQTSSMRSMKRMSDNMKVLQPKLDALKAKYKDNAEKLNQETMKLYKEHNINPMGGCLPSLAQFPIFLGFFYMLRTAVELRNSTFFWVEDLSRPDTVFTLIGIPINPLPLIMTASMVVYMRLQPSTGNDMQKRIMMLMPVMFLVFCYNFASALALYWTVQNLLSIVQFFLTKDIREGKPATATAGATVGGKPAIVEPPPGKKGKKK